MASLGEPPNRWGPETETERGEEKPRKPTLLSMGMRAKFFSQVRSAAQQPHAMAKETEKPVATAAGGVPTMSHVSFVVGAKIVVLHHEGALAEGATEVMGITDASR